MPCSTKPPCHAYFWCATFQGNLNLFSTYFKYIFPSLPPPPHRGHHILFASYLNYLSPTHRGQQHFNLLYYINSDFKIIKFQIFWNPSLLIALKYIADVKPLVPYLSEYANSLTNNAKTSKPQCLTFKSH